MTRFFSLLLLALFVVACGPSGTEVESAEAEADQTDVSEAEAVVYNVDAQASMVEWEGTKLVGSGHQGVIPVSQGQLMVAGNKIIGGKFTMDVANLENSDLDGEGKGKLEGHLRSPDFFDVEQYPNAMFDITRIQPATEDNDEYNYEITGNLTLKGSSRSITIPAMVSMDGNQLTATTPEFVIDRTEWGMEYGSGSLAGIAQDNIINDNVGLQIKLVANK